MKDEKASILVVEDEPKMRRLLELQLAEEGFHARTAPDAETGMQILNSEPFDVVVTDFKLPGMSGVEATKAICKEFPTASVVMLSTHDGEEDIYRSLQAGARTYLLKTAARNELIETIRGVHAGERRISPAVGARLADRMARPELTSREIDVLGLIVKGRSNKEIASELAIAEVTVKLHVGHLLAKLGVNDRTQATTTALQRGIIHLD